MSSEQNSNAEHDTVSMTHEQYIDAIREVVAARLNDDDTRHRLMAAKLTYGSGQPGVRGTCFYDAWENGHRHEFIEVCASGEQSHVQLAGTMIHELAHCVAGPEAGHSRTWKLAARALGLTQAEASNQEYRPADFDPEVWARVQVLPLPSDGRPAFAEPKGGSLLVLRSAKVRPCPLGVGTRGGSSHGHGSGSRLRLFVCSCDPPVRIRVARDEERFRAQCLDCGAAFKRADCGKVERSQGLQNVSNTRAGGTA